MNTKARKSQLMFFGLFILAAGLIFAVHKIASPIIFAQTNQTVFPAVAKSSCGSASGGPTDNPVAVKYGASTFPWVSKIRWNCVYNIQDYKGGTLIERFNSARDAAANNGGGVVYFPSGNYSFTDSISLKDGVVIRGETPSIKDAKSKSYNPSTNFEFPKYVPTFSGSGTPTSTAFKEITTHSANPGSNLGIVNLDINRAQIKLTPSGESNNNKNQNIVVFGVRSNNVAEPDGAVPQPYQNPWQRFSNRFGSNIKIKAFANVLVANNRLNDAVTDNYEQPGYILRKSKGTETVTYSEGWKAPFSYTDHYGIVVNRISSKKLVTDPKASPGSQLFRKGIVIQDNWVYHTMRIGIHASGDGLVIRNNQIRDQKNKVTWVSPDGRKQPKNDNTFENRAIDWSGWNVLIEGNDYEVYRHKIMDGRYFSIDGEGILIQECCGGTSVNGVTIRNNTGNSYIGLFKVPKIQNVLITENRLLTNARNTNLIYVSADTNNGSNRMDNVRIERNTLSGDILAKASLGGNNNSIVNNRSNSRGSISYSCGIKVEENVGFEVRPCKT